MPNASWPEVSQTIRKLKLLTGVSKTLSSYNAALCAEHCVHYWVV